jgi:hypothetical protein
MNKLFGDWIMNWLIGMLTLGVILINNIDNEEQILVMWILWGMMQPLLYTVWKCLDIE